jgi:hypothetical protein
VNAEQYTILAYAAGLGLMWAYLARLVLTGRTHRSKPREEGVS